MMNTFSVHKDLANPKYISWINFLSQTEGWSRDQIEDYQLNELRNVVRNAYDNTSGYRALYNSFGFAPADLKTLSDLSKFPCVEKEMIRDRLEDFSVQMPDRHYVTTGGSTGIPLGMYRDPDALAKELASKAYQYYRVGWREGDRQMVLRGLPIDTPEHMIFVPEFNEYRCSSYYLIPEQMELYRQKMLEYSPEWLRCYPSSGYIFAKWLQETNKPFPQLKGILCASENLYDFQKQTLGMVLNARVFSHYGHNELAVLAGFCEYQDVYHVMPQYGYAELVDPRGQPVSEPGQIGEIIATSFIMRATPFIRYRTRDLAILEGWECPSCRRPHQLWRRIEGRLQEFVITGTGRHISMTAINFHDDIFDNIKQFQFYQEEKGHVVFRYIPKGMCSSAMLEDIRLRLLAKLGDDVVLSMDKVKDIPPTGRGKHRFLIQKLDVEFHDL